VSGWTEKRMAFQEALEQLVEEHRHVIGPHERVDEGDPTYSLPDGTWVCAGFVMVVEWKNLDNDADDDDTAGEYVRLIRSKGLSEVGSAGLLHTALYDMD